jgi:hypothetical protein
MPDKPRLCPLVEEQLEECYFMRMTSSDISKTVLYCLGSYEECDIYRKKRNDRSCPPPLQSPTN